MKFSVKNTVANAVKRTERRITCLTVGRCDATKGASSNVAWLHKFWRQTA